MTEKYAGTTNFIWWFGVVEDRKDPLMLGRCRVRIYNLHTDDKSKLPTEFLPWATPIQPITSAGTVEIGQSPTGLIEGSVVFGFFADGKEAQIPMMFGTFAGKPTVEGEEVHDVAQRAREVDNLKVEYIKDLEPKMSYAAKYPYNKTYTSEAEGGKGSLLEIDDTPGAERLLAFHRKGTYIEISADGRLVVKGVANSYYLTVGDGVVGVQGNLTIIVQQSCGVAIEGNTNVEIRGSLFANVTGDIYVNTAANAYINVAGDLTVNCEGDSYINTVGKTFLHSDGDLRIDSDSNIDIEAGGEITITGSKIYLN